MFAALAALAILPATHAAHADDGHGHAGTAGGADHAAGDSGQTPPATAGTGTPDAASKAATAGSHAPMPPADQGPPVSAIPPMTLIWLAMGVAALGLVGALLAFGTRPLVMNLMASLKG